MPTNYEQIGEQAIQALKDRMLKSVKDPSETVYCDLGGLVLNAEQYCRMLDDDHDFAKNALEDVFVAAQPTEPSDYKGITVRERLFLASQVAQFYDKNGMKSSSLTEFMESRPLIAATYSRDDLSRVKDTLHFEHGIDVTVPTQKFLDDVCKRNGLAPYKS